MNFLAPLGSEGMLPPPKNKNISKLNLAQEWPCNCISLDIPKSTAVAAGKQVLFSKGDSSRQAPATHFRHTFSGLAQASHALPASFWYKQGYHLGKWRGQTLRIFQVTAIQSRSNFPWIFLGFSNAHQTVIHTEMKLLKTYLVAEARVCEFGLFGG